MEDRVLPLRPVPADAGGTSHEPAYALARAGRLAGAFRLLGTAVSARLASGMQAPPGRAGPCVLVDGGRGLTLHGGILNGVTETAVGAGEAGEFLLLIAGRGGAVFHLAAGTPGLTIERIAIPGLADAAPARLRFDGCSVAGMARLDPAAVEAFHAGRSEFTLAAATAAIELAGVSVIAAGTFAAERGLLDHQMVRHRLAELDGWSTVLRAMADEAWRCAGHGWDLAGERVRAVAVAAVDLVPWVVDGSLQVLGGLGYMAAHWVSRAYRETRSLPVVIGPLPSAGRRSRRRWRDPLQPADIGSFKEEAASFARRWLHPQLHSWRQAGELPREAFLGIGSAGYLGLAVPPELGGLGCDMRHGVALVESLLDWRTAGPVLSLLVPAWMICPLVVGFSTPEQQRELLPGLMAGTLIPSLAATEPGGSSGLLRDITTTAAAEGDHWVLDGEKTYITNGPIADIVFVLARSRPEGGALGMSMIAVPTVSPGFILVERLAKLGLHLSPTGRLRFERCRVPKSATIGNANHGYAYFGGNLSAERLLIAAGSVAMAKSCLAEARMRIGSRGRAALELETARLDACRALCADIALAMAHGEPAVMKACMAKYLACDAARAAIETCRLHLTEPEDQAWIEEVSCDARALTIFAGASDSLRDLHATRIAGRFRLNNRSNGAVA